jgi:ribonuclease-3
MALYQEAFTHRSMNLKDAQGERINYERLEFLGDTMLSSVVSAYIYLKYPKAQEGKLTKLRSKIVSRENLNNIGQKFDLLSLIIPLNPKANFGNDILGNLLEALIGALYVDQGYVK